MTTVIAAKAFDGIVVACDSQGSMVGIGMKKLDVNKIVPMGKAAPNPSMLMAGSGDNDHISILSESLSKVVAGKDFTDAKLREEVGALLVELHRVQNVERAKALGLKLDEAPMFYHPEAVLAARLKEGKDYCFRLYYLRPDGYITPIENYQCLGTGGVLANFLINAFERQLGAIGGEWSKTTVEMDKAWLPIIVNQVKFSDMYSGGRTKLAVVDKSGFHEVPESEILSLQQMLVDVAKARKGLVDDAMLAVLRSWMGV